MTWHKGGVAVLACLLAGCAKEKVAEVASDPPVVIASSGEVTLAADSAKRKQIKIEPVVVAEVPQHEVIAPGKIEANPNRVSRVVLPLAGRIAAVLARLGDQVQAGAPLITLESPDGDAAVSANLQAQSQISQAKSALLKAQSDVDRTKDLYAHSAIAKKEVLNAEAALAQAQATLDQAVVVQKQALRRLEILGLNPNELGQKLTVRAPISGKILELNVAPGEFRNDLSAPLLTIADLSSVWVASDVPETDIRFIDPGEQITIELTAYPGETFRGKVTRIADTVDPQTRTVKVRAEMDNARGRLRPEMFGKIRHIEGTLALPVIPASAIVQGESRNIVYKVSGKDTFTPVAVKLGDRVGDRVSILDGLQKGDLVVTDGVMLLRGN
ncbi:MAG: efflux RND transporter periplasmic adaptor subunit [Bryobacteraceae bacterium]